MNIAAKSVLAGASLLTMACLAGGCGSAHHVAASVDPAGTYVLVSVDGAQVPTTVSHQGNMLQVRSGTFVIGADGTCSTTTVFVPPSGTEVRRTVTATYIQSGVDLTMRWRGAGTTVGTVEGTTFTMDNEGKIWVYRK